MKTNVYEIVNGIFRIMVAPTDDFEYNHFLIVDKECMLVHAGSKNIFSIVSKLVGELINLKDLRHITFSHFESDESGSLNEWLKIAPNAVPVIGNIGMATMLDFSGKKPQVVSNGQILDLGRNKIKVLETPHIPHGWEALLFYELTNGILFSSDLGAQPGINVPVTDEDHTGRIMKFMAETGFIPVGENLKRVTERLEKLEISYIATMHGSTLKGKQIKSLFKAWKTIDTNFERSKKTQNFGN
jgi:flavorubredoxin